MHVHAHRHTHMLSGFPVFTESTPDALVCSMKAFSSWAQFSSSASSSATLCPVALAASQKCLALSCCLVFFFFLFLTGMSFPFVLPLPLKSYFSGPFPRTPPWDSPWPLPHSSSAEMITFLFFFCAHRGESRFSLYLTILSKSNLNHRALFSPKYLLMKRLNAQQSWKNFTINTNFSSILSLLWTLYDTWLYRIPIRLSMLSSVC